ncbi:MAG: DUF1513 domain-containing protein [Pseudomonadota bacterium]
MKHVSAINRRAFLKGAGLSFGAMLSNTSFASISKSDHLFASAYKDRIGNFGVLLFDEFGNSVSHFALPGRGHDITFHRATNIGVAFARRPGNFALCFDVTSKIPPQTIIAEPGRHFYGHGVFSRNGRLLYSAENDYEAAKGVIGIYDAAEGFRRVGEFSSYGIGPHQILLHPFKDVLIVANGGIETHPDFGRAKLNIPSMRPSLVFLDSSDGCLIESHELPISLHKLSIRHLDIDWRGKVVFGCQYEGARSDAPPLAGTVALGEEIQLWEPKVPARLSYANYVGSVSISEDGEHVAVTLPKDDKIAVMRTGDGTILDVHSVTSGFGVTSAKSTFLVSSEEGKILDVASRKILTGNEVIFDNHIGALYR